MRNDLLAAGAGFGPRERDDYFQFRGRVVISDLDKEKESKRLSKSAALLAAVSLLILTISLQAPFDVADKLHSGEIGSTYSQKKRARMFGDFIHDDGSVLYSSTYSIVLFTIAGFPYANLVLRRLALCFGGFFLWEATLLLLEVFIEGLCLTSPRGRGTEFVYFLVPEITSVVFMFAVAMSHPRRVLAHVLARLDRLGFRRWRRSLFWSHPAESLDPSFNVVFVLCFCPLFLYMAVVTCWDIHKICKEIVQSQKTVI